MKERPLSPHLQIYRPIFTMVMSIFHRITGSALYFVMFLFVASLVCLATNKNAYEAIAWFSTSWFGRLIMIGASWALFHHLLGGLRHFIWDTGRGFSREARERLAQLTLILSVALTLAFWGYLLLVKGF